MADKLGRNTLPSGHTRDDFKGFGPVATKDTDFTGCCLADMGCFNQDKTNKENDKKIDSNKFYHLAVVQSTKDSTWYAYYEWGRTNPDGRSEKPAFQFFRCSSQSEAQKTCEKQFHDKNTKRGKWETVGSIKLYVPKDAKKDLYVVRPTATRLVGLPCCENIANEDAKGAAAVVVATTTTTKKKTTAKKVSNLDKPTHKLFSDLMGGAVTYANAVMTGGKGKATLPTQDALDSGRQILDDAMVRVGKVGVNVDAQINDRSLKLLTSSLYGLIPKKKKAGAPASEWILSSQNIGMWYSDIDAFETALQAQEIDIEEDDSTVSDVMRGIPAKVYHVPKGDPIYEYFIGNLNGSKHTGWWPNATRYQSTTGRSELKVYNLWAVERNNDRSSFRKVQEAALAEVPNRITERPMFQDNASFVKERPDLNLAEQKLFWKTNTNLMFHGTRSVNVPGIVRENLRFPKELTGVAITGAMFGPGSYFADDWSKSAGYCSHPGSRYAGDGGVKGRHSFMFAFDVMCGNPFVAPGPRGYAGPPAGHHCVFGKAGKSGVYNNEWIIYHKGRVEMRYLAEISW